VIFAAVEVAGFTAAQIGAVAVIVTGTGIAAAGYLRKTGTMKRKEHAVTPDGNEERGSDDPAPAGTVEYIKDIEGACPGAPPEFLLRMVRQGETRDQARAKWIDELRGGQDEKESVS